MVEREVRREKSRRASGPAIKSVSSTELYRITPPIRRKLEHEDSRKQFADNT